MYRYKYEMHMHTHPCSGGGDVVEAHIDELRKKGFAGMVITNHFYRGDTRINRELPWEMFVDMYKKDFLRAKSYASDKDFDVFFGIEEHIGDGREILIYGLTPDVLAAHPELKTAGLLQYSEIVHAAGGMLYQAHPYRQRSYISISQPFDNIEQLDGVEGWNAGNSIEENEKAIAFAKEHGIALIAGSDAHERNSVGRAGICTNVRIKDNLMLTAILRSGMYSLYKN